MIGPLSSPGFRIQWYNLRCLSGGNRSLVITPVVITMLVTIAQLLWRQPLSDTILVSTAETMGSLLAGFLGANLLDPEIRLRTGELVFCKPYAAGKLVAGRVLMALIVIELLVGCNITALLALRRLSYPGPALAAALAPSLFLCLLACALFIASSNVVLAYVGPILFWIWSLLGSPVGIRFDRLYNPILQISAWSYYLDSPSPITWETLVANDIVLCLVSILLFWWCCRRLRTAAVL